MESTISNLIFPRPAKSSYDINSTVDDGFPEARLVHIRRRDTKKFTFGYYVSQTLQYRHDCQMAEQRRGGGGRGVPSPPPAPRYILLYAHPNAADIGDMLSDASVLSHRCNIDVLLWEFRGYGLCDGAASERELYLDMEAVFDFVEGSLGIPSHQIILAGRSIGSGPSVQLAACLPTILNRRRLAKQRLAEGSLDKQRDAPMYRFNDEEGGAGGAINGSATLPPPLRLPLAGLFLQGAFTSISDAVDSLIDVYSGTTGVLAYTTGITKTLARKIVAERFRSVDVIPEVFCFENAFYDAPASSSSSSSPSTLLETAENRNKNQLSLAKKVWADTVTNYVSPPFFAIQHGDEDEIIPYSHALGLMAAIENKCNTNNNANGGGSSAAASSSSSYRTAYRGQPTVALRTQKGYGHNNLSIEEACTIIQADIIQKHTVMMEVLAGAYRHNEHFLNVLNFPPPIFVDLVAVVEKLLPAYVVGGSGAAELVGGPADFLQPPCSYYRSVYSNIAAGAESEEVASSTEAKRLFSCVLGGAASASSSSPSTAAASAAGGGGAPTVAAAPTAPKVPGVNSVAFDEHGYAYVQQQKMMGMMMLSGGGGGGALAAVTRSSVPAADSEGFNPTGFTNMAKELLKGASGGGDDDDAAGMQHAAAAASSSVAGASSAAVTPTASGAAAAEKAPSPSSADGLNDDSPSHAAKGEEGSSPAAARPSGGAVSPTAAAVAVALIDPAALLPPLAHPTMRYWTTVMVEKSLAPLGGTLMACAQRRVGGGGGELLVTAAAARRGSASVIVSAGSNGGVRGGEGGGRSVSPSTADAASSLSEANANGTTNLSAAVPPYSLSLAASASLPPLPAILTSAALQHDFGAILSTSIAAFTQHVAMRWLRMKAKRDMVQLRLRGATTNSYGFGSVGGGVGGSSVGGTPTNSTVVASSLLIGAGNTAPGALPPTALPPLQSPREFIYEHLAVFGSPFGVYLLPVINGRDSNMKAGVATSRAEQDAIGKSEKQKAADSERFPSSGFHAVVFGNYIADPASLTLGEAERECVEASGGAMLSPYTPFKCWYTHTVALSDAEDNYNRRRRGGGDGNAASASSSPTPTTTARRMKRMVERFPRVTLAEFEIPENILTTIERFINGLDHKVALGDALSSSTPTLPIYSSSSFSSSSASPTTSRQQQQQYSSSHADFDNGDVAMGERHVDDLCGAMAIDNSLMLLGEADVDRIEIECERLVIGLVSREVKGAVALAELTASASVSDGGDTYNSNSSSSSSRVLAKKREALLKTMPLTTLVMPFIDLLATPPSDSASGRRCGRMRMVAGGDGDGDANNESDDEDQEDVDPLEAEGFLLPHLYGPSSFVESTRMLLPPTVIVRLYKSFSHDFYNTTGDLGKVLADVKARRLWFEQHHPMYVQHQQQQRNINKNGTTAHQQQSPPSLSSSITTALDECLDSLVFDLQSALLRNVPEGYCGSVGCGRYRDADEAVCILQEVYLKTFIEAETWKLPFSPRAGEGLKAAVIEHYAADAGASNDHRDTDDDDDDDSHLFVEGLGANCRFVASPVGGSDAARRHVLLGRAELADPSVRDALHWIMPPANLSAAATESNNDCVIM